MYRLTTIKRLTRRGGRKFGLAAVAVAAFISLSALPASAQTRDNTNDAGTRQQLLATMVLMGAQTRDNTYDAGTAASQSHSTNSFTFTITLRGAGLAPGGTPGLSYSWYLGHVSPFAGQTIRIRIEAADASTASLSKPSEKPGVLVGAGAGAAMHVRAFSRSTGALLWSRELPNVTVGRHTFDINRDELREAGEPGTGLLELLIEMVILPRAAGSGQAGGPGVDVSAPTIDVMDNVSGTAVRGGIWKTTNFLTPDPLRSRPIVFTGLE